MATFGKTTIGVTQNNWTGDYILGCLQEMPEKGTITKITAYLRDRYEVTAPGKGYIYADNGGVPGVKLAEGTEITVGAVLDWQDFPVTYVNNSGVLPLWLVYFVDTGFTTKYDGGAVDQTQFRLVTYPNEPDPFGVASKAAFEMSLYATYTPSAPSGGSGSSFPPYHPLFSIMVNHWLHRRRLIKKKHALSRDWYNRDLRSR